MAFIFFTVGQKGSGKSLYESRRAVRCLNSYLYTEKKYPNLRKRIYFSKQKFAERVERLELVYKMDWLPNPHWQEGDDPQDKMIYATVVDDRGNKVVENPNGHLYYWSSAYELLDCPRLSCWKGRRPHPVHNADIFWDEIADDIPREKWNDIPEDLKQVFSHARKRGNRIFANTQKYEMVAVDFRRQVDSAVWLMKIAGSRDIDVSLPNPRFVWVFQIALHFNPLDVEHENDPRALWELRDGLPRPHFYTRKDVSVFDTQWEVPPTMYNVVREVHYRCIHGPDCKNPDDKIFSPKHKTL